MKTFYTDEEVLAILEDMLSNGELSEEEFLSFSKDFTISQESMEEKIQHRASLYKELSCKEINQLSMDELVLYRKRERAFLLSEQNKIRRKALRSVLHPLVPGGLKLYHEIQGIHVETIGSIPKTNRPIIFAASHIGYYDVEIVLQAIKKHAYIFSGDEEMMYRTFDGGLFEINGTAYVDPEDNIDCNVGFLNVVKHLKNRICILWYPEGTWNLTDNYPIMPIHNRIIEAAVLSDAIIVPISLDQRDKEKGIDFVVNIGDAMDPTKLLNNEELTMRKKNELAEVLRSEMAGLKYNIWEHAKRDEIPDDYYQKFLDKRIEEWAPYYTLDIIRGRMFNPNHYVYEKTSFS